MTMRRCRNASRLLGDVLETIACDPVTLCQECIPTRVVVEADQCDIDCYRLLIAWPVTEITAASDTAYIRFADTRSSLKSCSSNGG